MSRWVWAAAWALATACGEEDLDEGLWEGRFVLERPAELVRLGRLESIAGDLVVRTNAGLGEIRLERLRELGGDLIVEGLPAGTETFALVLPDLRVLTGALRLADVGVPVVVVAPRLGRVDRIELTRGRFALELELLNEVRGPLVAQAATLDRLELPRLTELRGPLRLVDVEGPSAQPLSLGFPALARAGGLDLRVTAPVTLDLPLLEAIEGDLVLDRTEARIAAPRVQRVDGDLRVRESRFDWDPTGLERIAGYLEVREARFLGPPRRDALRALDFPRLSTIGRTLELDAVEDLEALGLNALVAVGGGIRLTRLPALVEVGMAEAAALPADLELVETGPLRLDAPRLASIGGSLRVARTGAVDVALGGLAAVEQSVEILSVPLRALDLEALARVGQDVVLDEVAGPEELDLGRLEDVGRDLRLVGSGGLRGVGLAALERVGSRQAGDLVVSANAQLERLDLARLRSVSRRIDVSDNPNLPETTVATRLGTVSAQDRRVCGNAGGEACPPP